MESFRPNRSDIYLSREDEAEIVAETREYFDGVEPKRHTNPQSSEYSTQYVDALSSSATAAGIIPELAEFQRLKNDHHKLVYSGSNPEEEFVETDYYKDLNSIDKQHHTTGTGFIKMDNANDKGYVLAPDSLRPPRTVQVQPCDE